MALKQDDTEIDQASKYNQPESAPRSLAEWWDRAWKATAWMRTKTFFGIMLVISAALVYFAIVRPLQGVTDASKAYWESQGSGSAAEAGDQRELDSEAADTAVQAPPAEAGIMDEVLDVSGVPLRKVPTSGWHRAGRYYCDSPELPPATGTPSDTPEEISRANDAVRDVALAKGNRTYVPCVYLLLDGYSPYDGEIDYIRRVGPDRTPTEFRNIKLLSQTDDPVTRTISYDYIVHHPERGTPEKGDATFWLVDGRWLVGPDPTS